MKITKGQAIEYVVPLLRNILQQRLDGGPMSEREYIKQIKQMINLELAHILSRIEGGTDGRYS